MAEIIKVFKEQIPAMRFIGKKYSGFVPWGEWFANCWFDELENLMGGTRIIKKLWENGGAYVGLERRENGKLCEYWIGMFMPVETVVPDQFEYIDFPKANLGVCWIYGREEDVHDTSRCKNALKDNGIKVIMDENGVEWSFENCLCPRYTTPDENDNIILDYCYFVE